MMASNITNINATLGTPDALSFPDRGLAGEYSVRVFRSAAEIEQIRDAWMAWQHHPNSDIDFYLMIQASKGDSLKPYIAVLYRDSKPEAILVGRIEDSSIDIRLGYFRLFAPKVRILNIVYEGGLGNLSETNAAAMIGDILLALDRGEADLAIFRYLHVDSPAYRVATQLPGLLQRDHCLSSQAHRRMTLPSSVEAFRSRFSGKVRKNHKWQAAKLLREHNGDVRVQGFRHPSELEQLFRDAETVACKTYQRGLGVGFEDNPAMRRRLDFEAARGSLLAYILYVAGRPTAFWIGSVYKHTYFSSFMGYDPSLAQYSPGTYLLLEVIESFCTDNSNCQAVDFGLGDAAYKSLLGDSVWQEASVYVFGSTAKGLAINALRTPVILIDGWLKKGLDRVKFLGRVKRFWRQRATRSAN